MEENEKKQEEILEVELNETSANDIPEENENTGRGLSIASMVLGICSIVLLSSFLVSTACGVLAIIFGLKGKKKEKSKMANAGFITGIIGTGIQAFMLLCGFILGFTMASVLL